MGNIVSLGTCGSNSGSRERCSRSKVKTVQYPREGAVRLRLRLAGRRVRQSPSLAKDRRL